jgi:hypothetical protein
VSSATLSAGVFILAKPKLRREQWVALDIQLSVTPSRGEMSMASGEHYILISLLNKFGYYPRSCEAAMDLAEELLSNGHS